MPYPDDLWQIEPPPRVPGPRDIAVVPNVLLFIADDVGREYLEGYNLLPADRRVDMPNYRRLMQSGVRFSNNWSNPTCSPTRASMISGLYPYITGIGVTAGGENQPLLESSTSLPRSLKVMSENMIRCGCFGKWHLSGFTNRSGAFAHPLAMGFDHFVGTLGNPEGTDNYNSSAYFSAEPGRAGPIVKQFRVNEWTPRWIADRAGEWIRSQGNNPWFCWFASHLAHSPWNKPPDYAYDTETYVLTDSEAIPGGADKPVYFKAMLQALDWQLGYLLGQIPQKQLASTLVIFCSDNGTDQVSLDTGLDAWLGAGYTGRVKSSPYALGCNVPLIVSGSRVAAPGRVNDTMISPTDFYATILDMMQLQYGFSEIVGLGPSFSTSFRYAIENTAPDTFRTSVRPERFAPNGQNIDAATSGVRSLVITDAANTPAKWALVRRPTGPNPSAGVGVTGWPSGTAGVAVSGLEFYNMLTDPNQTTNLIGSTPINLTGPTLTAYNAAVAGYATAFQVIP